MTETDGRSRPAAAPGYWQIVWGQFRGNRYATVGLYVTYFFFFLAFFAPFLAQNLPLIWTENGKTSYPLLREFFAPMDTTEVVLEISFNYLFLFFPCAVAAWKLCGLIWPGVDAARSRGIALTLGVALSLLVTGAVLGVLYATEMYLLWSKGQREAFVLVTGIIALGLLGLIGIIMTAAGQMAASPRWLAVLAVGVLVSAPFWVVKGRMDARDYRQLQADKLGSGVFPLIPYGPTETGYGAKLPPSWYIDSSLLESNSLIDIPAFCGALLAPDAPAGSPAETLRDGMDAATAAALGRIVARGSAGGKDETAEAKADLGQLLNWLNGIVSGPQLTLRKWFGDLDLARDARDYANAAAGTLSPRQLQRLNRRALEAAFPRYVIRGSFERRKEAGDKPGWHLFGTDESGRDILVRMIHGGRVSLSVGFVSVIISTVIGLILGSVAAYYGGIIDFIISRLIEIMMSFPTFFLILTIIAILDKRSILNIMLIIGFTSWTGVARLVRGEVLRQRKLDYVASAKALGATDSRIIFRHVLPNSVAAVLVSMSFGIAGAILTESGLSFMGIGVAPPTPTWGELLNQGRQAPLTYWWLVLFPGILIFLGVMAYNMVGEGLRDAMDPRLRK